MQTLSGLLQIAEKKERGPATTFESSHLLLAFVTIGSTGTIGRGALAIRSSLGEGAIRTILKKLREDEYVDANASGCFLTPAGRRVYESIWRKLSPMVTLQESGLGMGSIQVALAVRGGGKMVNFGIEQRDAAIRVGAAGVTTYVVKSGKFTIPGGSNDCENDYPDKAWTELRGKLSPKGGDAVILCGAHQDTLAKVGALSAALTLL